MKKLANGHGLSSSMNIHLVGHGSKEYADAVKLRDQVLRKPLGLAFTEAELAAEADQLHFVGYLNGEPGACAVLQWLAPGVAKMRQVAVKPILQGRGLGRQLVEAIEREIHSRGACKIVLHARQTAVAFYLRMGYEIIDDPFEEIGLPHRCMQKLLADPVEGKP
jgi:ribosomal protein S18 acetylase RimI-like enzyme